ncbi:ArsR/SmtB family transcription factor [Streptomyces sp. NPDC017546]|uniref:ArsR/SmtB family transcription factor n=1 Tax=unclassified Streptomyces TaxID=2593676 RepID=UPI00235E40A3|nr:winged helix-turn-helix domain-containing protein [Streptomyces sp. MMBL 11-1]
MSLMGNTADLDEAVENFLAAPRDLLRAELENLRIGPAHRNWARKLADGDREARLQVATALRTCHAVTVAPYWPRLRRFLASVRERHVGAMGEGGTERLLESLDPALVRWRPPVLEVHHSREADVVLGGRGLVISSAVFSSHQAEVLACPGDSAQAPVLALPAFGADPPPAYLWSVGDTEGRPLEELLGRTRTAVLEALADGCSSTGCSTTDLARRVRVSASSVSQHATVLRRAGLITTGRDGKAVRHTLTTLGAALLESGIPHRLRDTVDPTGTLDFAALPDPGEAARPCVKSGSWTVDDHGHGSGRSHR